MVYQETSCTHYEYNKENFDKLDLEYYKWCPECGEEMDEEDDDKGNFIGWECECGHKETDDKE
jgi:hypothetical protein